MEPYFKIYQILLLQTRLLNQVFSNILNQGYLLLLIIAFNTTSYCTVKLSSLSDVGLLYIVFPFTAGVSAFLISVLFATMAGPYDKSTEVMQSGLFILINAKQGQTMVEITNLRIMRMKVKAFEPLKLWVGHLYFVKRNTKLTILSLLINSTLYSLLTF